MPAGRPTTYTEEIGRAFCEAFIEHPSGIRSFCKQHPEFPSPKCIREWTIRYPEFGALLAATREARLQIMSEDIVDISDDDELEANDKRLRVETRKWLLSKLMHRTFGDKLDVTSGGEALQSTNATLIDQRVQSIIMQARLRKLGQHPVELDDNALKLLD